MDINREEKQHEIDSNFVFFQERLPELMTTHSGKYALIRHRKIIGIYDSAIDAQVTGMNFFADNVFSIQKISDEPINLGFFSHAVHMGKTQ